MPEFNTGKTAPHYTYEPRTRRWMKWAEYEDGYVGTLRGHATGGHGNCQAFQVEIVGYSNPEHSPWVGDFTNENYEDLAEFYSWAMDRYGIGSDVTETPEGGWKYGSASPYRLTDTEWDAFSGLTCHGAVPHNSHWDTGVLDLDYIHDLALGGDMFTHFNIGDERPEWEPISWLLYMLEGGTVDPNENSAQVTGSLPYKTNVKLVQSEDFDLIGRLTGMSAGTLARAKSDGLYRFGKELASVQEQAFR